MKRLSSDSNTITMFEIWFFIIGIYNNERRTTKAMNEGYKLFIGCFICDYAHKPIVCEGRFI